MNSLWEAVYGAAYAQECAKMMRAQTSAGDALYDHELPEFHDLCERQAKWVADQAVAARARARARGES